MSRALLSGGIRAVLCAAALVACAGDPERESEEGPSVIASSREDARFALITQDGDRISSHLSLTKSLEAKEPLSLQGAYPVSGRGLVVNVPGTDSLFVAGGKPEMMKYKLAADGSLVSAGIIKFKAPERQKEAAEQIDADFASQLQLVSATKAYFFDMRNAKVYVWNPTETMVTKEIDQSALLVPDATMVLSAGVPVKRAGKIALAVGYRSADQKRVIKQAVLLVVDTVTDAITVLRDDRCGYVRDAVEGEDGRVYLATEAWGSALHRLDPTLAPAPCLLRTDADLTRFDSAYYQDLNLLAGGVAGSLVKSRDGKAYTKVLDQKHVKISRSTTADALVKTPAWRWAEVKLGDAPTVKALADARLGTGSLVVLDTLDKRFVAEVEESRTALVDLTNGIGPVTLTTTGGTYSIAQLR